MAEYSFATDGNTIVSDFVTEVKNKTFLITGPSLGGIGAETALSLAQAAPSQIILLGRSLPKIQPTIDSIHAINPSIRTPFIQIKLDSLTSVRAAAAQILADSAIPHVDVVVNNAAIMACPYAVTEDGFEMQFATNHLAHFLLTNLLMPKILLGACKRIVNVSSSAHLRSGVRFDDIGFSNGAAYHMWEAYAQAKTANILFSVSLNQRLGKEGVGSFALHPGSIASGLQKYLTEEMRQEALDDMKARGYPIPTMRKTLQQGCATTLRAALDPGLKTEGSVYLVDCQIAEPGSALKAEALEPLSAKRLWSISEEIVGQKFEY
jgi:NAD(P)-dependent dehydrogenase (short-subunit alcohol dehydrogenase family)